MSDTPSKREYNLEREIIRRVLHRAREAGLPAYLIIDEEDFEHSVNNDGDALGLLDDLEIASIYLRGPGVEGGNPSILIIRGNGHDVIADYAAAPSLRPIMDKIIGIDE